MLEVGKEGGVDVVKCGKFGGVGGADDGEVGVGVAANEAEAVAEGV